MGYADAILADGPVSWWRLDESSGTNAADQMGAHPGTYHGTPTLGQTGALVASGDADAAVLLNGSTDYVSVAASMLASGATVSVEGWANPSSLAGTLQGLFGGRANAGWWGAGTANATTIKFWSNTGLWVVAWTVPALVVGQYFHFAFVYNDSTLAATLYLNGQSQGAQTLGGGMGGIPDANTFGIGTLETGSAGFWPGDLDEVAVFNYLLSATQVAAHYNAGTGLPVRSGSPSRMPLGA